jgi:hypothetical protein
VGLGMLGASFAKNKKMKIIDYGNIDINKI